MALSLTEDSFGLVDFLDSPSSDPLKEDELHPSYN